jgi:hypothetical protein
MKGSCKCIVYMRGELTGGDSQAWGIGHRGNNSAQRTSMFQNVIQGLGLEWILWNILHNGKWTCILKIK